jgi:lysine-N-methylase
MPPLTIVRPDGGVPFGLIAVRAPRHAKARYNGGGCPLPEHTPRSYVALRYMTRFSCTGPACPDHCCQGWQVSVGQGQLARIRKALRGDPAQLRRFEEVVELRPAPERRKDQFAQLRFAPDAPCSLLDADRLCSLHRHHGQEVLPTICAVFPRQLFRARDRVELTGAVACPEVVRLLLLSADATDLVPATAAHGGLPHEHPALDPRLPPPLVAFVEAVRARVHDVLGQGALPLRGRLYLTLELLNQLHGRAPGSAEAAALLEALGEAEVLEDLHGHFQEQLPRIGLDLGPVVALVALVQEALPQARFSAVAGAILRSFLPQAPGSEGAGVPMAQVVADYARRREIVLGAFGPRIDQYFQNYARHVWVEAWLGQIADLAAFARSLTLGLTTLRSLLLAHPDAVRAAQDPAAGTEALDGLAVELVYSFARAMSNADLQVRLAQLADEKVPDLARAIALLAL